uniref:Secreted protein n=1 Tax=Caenorhabditis tropicalis TaxID=1561998 RepID=A0A1I7USW0_9PELO
MILMLILLNELHLEVADEFSLLNTPTDIPHNANNDYHNDNKGDNDKKDGGFNTPSSLLHIELFVVEVR